MAIRPKGDGKRLMSILIPIIEPIAYKNCLLPADICSPKRKNGHRSGLGYYKVIS